MVNDVRIVVTGKELRECNDTKKSLKGASGVLNVLCLDLSTSYTGVYIYI